MSKHSIKKTHVLNMSDYRNQPSAEDLLITRLITSTLASHAVLPEATKDFLAKAIEILAKSNDRNQVLAGLHNLRDSIVEQIDPKN